MTLLIKDASFFAGAAAAEQFPPSPLPEIAVLGRSNVGKSTFINRITQRKKLAHASATPGRTQQCNFFSVTAQLNDTALAVTLVDLPGFGFAKLSKEARANLQQLILDYIQSREQLQLLCILNDCRRTPQEDELTLQKIAFESGCHTLVVLTKRDKLGNSEAAQQIRTIAAGYGLDPEDLIVSGDGIAVEPFWERVQLLTANAK